MWLIRLAMGRPVTIMVAIVSVVILSALAVLRMKVDIFPDLKVPRISVIQPYGGLDPAQMEGYIVTNYEQHFFYINNVDHISSKSIQSASVIDIYFRPEANMADAMAQVIAQVERTKSYLPPGTVDPFVLRFDVGQVPVGFLVFDSPNRSLGEIQDLVFSRVRPVVATTPGVSTPPPFGGNQRSIVITINQTKLNQYHVSMENLVNALSEGNSITPSGIVRSGDLQQMTVLNSVPENIQELGKIVVKHEGMSTVFLRDLGSINDSTDITTGYALVNGNRTVYMAVSKQASASTLAVVEGVKSKLEYMQSLLPEDIKISFQFDQSVYVTEALHGLLVESAIGAGLTGIVVLIFLRNFVSSLIVVLNIPFALLAAVCVLWLMGQSINIMTLGGMALAVGILVDEATVVIENIHSHLGRSTNVFKAIFDASTEVAVPRLLAMLSVVSVFTPAFFMVGTTQSMFVPLSLAVGLAMFASYILSGTFVPVMCGWLIKPGAVHHEDPPILLAIRNSYKRFLIGLHRCRFLVVPAFFAIALAISSVYFSLGQEIFPLGNPKGFQLRIKGPTGTRFEKTEKIAVSVLEEIGKEVGPQKVEVSIGYVGTQPPTYAIANAYMWTSGPQEAVLMISFKDDAHIITSELKERLRKIFEKNWPDVSFSFEAGDIVTKIMNFGSNTPIQVDVDGPNFGDDEAFADKVLTELKTLDYLRDVTLAQPMNFPTVEVNVDRVRAGQLGVTAKDVGRTIIGGTYSSRFMAPVFWRDPKNGLSYQVQVQVPQGDISSFSDIGSLPVKGGSFMGPFVRDVSTLSYGTMPGEYDHYNMRRTLSITANLAGDDLGKAAREVEKAVANCGKPPRGVRVTVRGQVPIMRQVFESLYLGVGFAVVSIALMLAAFFQSIELALVIISIVPAIVCGALLALFLSHSTLNIQSFMGTIMATGVGVANSILVCVFAEERRLRGMSAKTAAIGGAAARMRPVLMTSLAMVFGMVPMALGMSDGGERTAPLGRAVIGGLLVSTPSVLLVLPIIYAMVRARASKKSPSLLPEDNPSEDNSAEENEHKRH
jgi:multidrug efflux pump subunit AcrB